MLLNKIIINKKFITILWFRYIFLTYNFLYFYNLDSNLDKNSYKNILNIISYHNDIIGSRSLFSLRGLFEKKSFFNFLNNNFLILQSNKFIILPELSNNNILLQAISYKGYFIKSIMIQNINKYNLFYQNNYIFIKSYYSYFFVIIFKIILLLKKIVLFSIISLSNKLDNNVIINERGGSLITTIDKAN